MDKLFDRTLYYYFLNMIKEKKTGKTQDTITLARFAKWLRWVKKPWNQIIYV